MSEVIRFAFLGLGLGALYALASQGLIVVYRGSGVLNLAAGAMGTAAAFLTWDLSTRSGVPLGVAIALGVLMAAALGALTHLLVLRQLRQASPLARIAATLGILLVLQSAVVLRYGPNVEFISGFLPQSVWTISSDIVVPVDRFVLFGIAAALSLVLWLVYRYTRFGLATSAIAENERAAASLGWSPDLLAAVNWAIGSALAGFAAILVAPITTLQPANMTGLVLAAMAAALVANFRSFPIALAAGMAIGIAQTEIVRFWPQPGVNQAVPFVVIVLYLVVTGRALPLRDFFLQRLPAVGTGRVRPGLVAIGVVVVAVLVGTASSEWANAFIISFGGAFLLLSVVVVTGYAGQISLAQYAIAGIGAFIAGRLVATQGFPFWLAFVAGVAGAVLVGLAIALPAVRTRGINLAIVTLGLGTAIQLVVFSNGDWTGSIAGTNVGSTKLFGWSIDPVAHVHRYAFVSFGLLLLCGLAVANLRRGPSGRRLLAVRTNERAAASLGINVPAAKLYAFAVSAAIAAVGGIMIAFESSTITYGSTFANYTSITYVAWAFVGGIGYVAGVILAAPMARPGGIGTSISDTFFPGLGGWLDLIGGVTLILMVLLNQDGLAKESIKQWAWIGLKLHVPVGRIARLPGFRVAEPHQLAQERRSRVEPRTLEARGVCVRYGAVTAVDNLSLTLSPGRVVGLIGPNGAGKTSAIDAITGFERPADGELLLDGRRIESWSATRRARSGVSRSFQSLELFEDATVLENLRVASDPHDAISGLRDLVYPVSPPMPGEVVAAIHEFGLADQLERTVDELSYGQRRLLAIARAVATRPSVLLLDEPAAGLSSAESAELATLVRRLADDWGMSILIVEHDMSFVMAISDEVVVLDFGRPISTGTPEEVRNDPAVVAAYLGQPEPVEAVG
jgi:sulfate-transporting ATPase